MKPYSKSIPSLPHSLAAAQVDRYLMERATGTKPRVGARPRHLPAITISRMLGIPAKEIAALIGRELGFPVFDREVLETVGRDMRLGERIIESLDSGKRSALDSWIGRCLTFGARTIDPTSFQHTVSRVIRGISLHGSAIIIGRGANFILRGTDAFRVRLIASADLRAQALADGSFGGEPMSAGLARAEVERHAEERRTFMKKHFRADIDDPLGYDAILNLRRLDPDRAAAAIVSIYRNRSAE